MTPSARATPTELTTPEVALLAITNPRKLLPTPQSRLALTTKESYIWATLLASLAEAELKINPRRLLETLKEEIARADIQELQPGESFSRYVGAETLKSCNAAFCPTPEQHRYLV